MGSYLKHLEQLSSPATFMSKKNYFAWNILPFLETQNPNILEIGPGLGEFISFLNDRKIVNIDIADNDKGVLGYIKRKFKIRKSFYVKDLSRNKNLKNYDLIMMMQVLEHIPVSKHKAVLKLLFNALKRRGILLIIVPNANNPLGIVERYSDIQHTTSFTSQSLIDLVHNSGIKGYEMSIKGFEIPGYNVVNIMRKIFQKILHLLILGIMMVNGGLFFNILTPNIMLVIRRK
jgi:2-polyprenyl-3-methyl-5-hydroxy-6-metoxy-1,4-benzoquinol methylase